MEYLLKKAKENKIVAEKCEKEGYYHIAVSRYYYYIYQNILFFIEKDDDLKNNFEKYKKNNYSKNIHDITISFIIDSILNKESFEEINNSKQIHELKKLRNDADYKNCEFSKDKYEKQFKNKFESVEKILKRYKIILD
jgi:hypothetical protein